MSDNKKIKMILNGALGRMGSYVLDAVSDTNDIEIMHGVDPSVTSSTNSYKGVNVVLNLNQVLTEDVDVVVDFTNSEVTMDIVKQCRDNNVDLIIGSGKMHSLREFVDGVFKILKLNRKKVITNTKKFYRKIDIKSYRANTFLANKKIGWKTKTSFKQIIKKMVYDELF